LMSHKTPKKNNKIHNLYSEVTPCLFSHVSRVEFLVMCFLGVTSVILSQ